MSLKTITPWGRLSNDKHSISFLDENISSSENDITDVTKPGLVYGMGRSYGDVGTNNGGSLWSLKNLSNFISLNKDSKVLHVEAGICLKTINDCMQQHGLKLPVMPGTQYLTVGGAIANDIHGKTHHTYGSFANNVEELILLRTTGEKYVCSLTENPEWFRATIGGAGLTGIILSAKIKLIPFVSHWIEQQNIIFNNISEFFEISKASEQNWEGNVAWLDCLGKNFGRGIFVRGNDAKTDRPFSKPRELTFPNYFGPSLVSAPFIKTFNTVYFGLSKRSGISSLDSKEMRLIPSQKFYYPLDKVQHWNRIYGRKGFHQYQSVLPMNNAKDAMEEKLKVIQKHGQGSIFSILKIFGEKESRGILSFPRHGLTSTFDFPERGQVTKNLLKDLDSIVLAAGGRLYLAKDARMSKEFFEETYPNFNDINTFRDPGISSSLSKRLLGW